MIYLITANPPHQDDEFVHRCESWEEVKAYVQATSEDYAIHPNDFRIYEAREINFVTRFVLEVSPS